MDILSLIFVEALSYLWEYILIAIIVILSCYLFISYMIYKIGCKYNNNELFVHYTIPFYRYYKLILFMGANPLLLIGISANLILLLSFKNLLFGSSGFVALILHITTISSLGFFWANMAKSMNRDPVLWGFAGAVCALFLITAWIPYAIFAFSSMQPKDEYTNGSGISMSPSFEEALQSIKEKSVVFKDGLANTAKTSNQSIEKKINSNEPITEVPKAENKIKGQSLSLCCVSGSCEGLKIPLTAVPIFIGRDPELAHLIMDSPDVSRKHASIYAVTDGSVLLEDLNSSNGTFLIREGLNERVNGICKLKIGDKFSVGLSLNLFEIQQP